MRHPHTRPMQLIYNTHTRLTDSLFGRRRRPAHLRDYEVYAGADASSEDDEVSMEGGNVECVHVLVWWVWLGGLLLVIVT